MTLQPLRLNLLMNEKNLIFFIVSAQTTESYPHGPAYSTSATPGGSVEYNIL
jgi:hypothetical protein